MSWSMTLRKQSGPTNLPARNGEAWANIITSMVLNNNTTFIDKIEDDDFETTGIGKTIEVLEDWKQSPRRYRTFSALLSLVRDDKLLSDEKMREIISQFTIRVLPELKEKQKEAKRREQLPNPTKQTKVGDKVYEFRKIDDVIRYLEDSDFNKNNGKKLLQFLHENLPKRTTIKAEPKLKQWMITNEADDILLELIEDGAFDNKSPLVRLSGIKLKKKTDQLEGTGRKFAEGLSEKEILKNKMDEFKNFKVKESFDGNDAKIYYKLIMSKDKSATSPLKPKGEGFSRLSVDDLMNGDVLKLLTLEITETTLMDLIEKGEESVVKDEEKLLNQVVDVLLDKGQFDLGGVQLKLTEDEKTEIGGSKEKLKRLIKLPFKGQEKGIAVDYKKFLPSLKEIRSVTKEEKEFIESLSEEKVDDLFDELVEFDLNVLADKVSDLREINKADKKGVKPSLFREKDGIIIMISKKNYDLFNELKQEVLDTNKEELEEYGFKDVFYAFLESGSESEVQSSSEPAELEYNLEGFDKLEKKLAEYIYSSLLGGLDLEETFQNGNMSITFDISDILKVLYELGGAFNQIVPANYVNDINHFEASDDINLMGEKPYEFARIKRLADGLKTVLPKLQEHLINSAKEHVEEILQNPSAYLEKEIRNIAKKAAGSRTFVGERPPALREDRDKLTDEQKKKLGAWKRRRELATREMQTTLDRLKNKGLIVG